MINFLGIGAQKAGTTWLYEQMRHHPDIAFPAGKEVHFWNQQRHLGIDWWRNLFTNEDDGKFKGEITPAYALLEPATIAEIRATCPDVRLFMSLRNPIDRAWSSALMALGRAELEFEEASDQWFIDHFQSQGSLRRGDYLGSLDNWLAVFPAEQLHIIWFDDIVKNPKPVLQSLAVHIGASPQHFADIDEVILQAPVWQGPGHPLRPSLLPVLQQIYWPAIRRLADRFQRDLSGWGCLE